MGVLPMRGVDQVNKRYTEHFAYLTPKKGEPEQCRPHREQPCGEFITVLYISNYYMGA